MTLSSELMFVTGNQHKVEEANGILSEFNLKVRMASCEKIEIQSDSLTSIAEYAASVAASKIAKPVLVEDSGLFIAALSGFPGPYSSFTFNTIGCKGVLKLLRGISDRRARFRCAVSFCKPGSNPTNFEGYADGAISLGEKGLAGFGFDPIFIPLDGDGRTFAEMPSPEKGRLSHRGAAFRAFGKWYTDSKTAKLK